MLPNKYIFRFNVNSFISRYGPQVAPPENGACWVDGTMPIFYLILDNVLTTLSSQSTLYTPAPGAPLIPEYMRSLFWGEIAFA